MRAWLGSHRSGVIAAVSATAITAVIATVALVSGGYSAQRIDLGDGSVWVTNSAQGVVGRANTQILALDSVVPSGGKSIDVVQAGAAVLVADTEKSAAEVVDAATSEVTASIALPPKDPHVDFAGDTVVVVADGDVWTTTLDAVGDFDASSEPRLRLGAGTVTSVDPAGRLVAFTPTTGTLRVIDASTGTVAQSLTIAGIDPTDDLTITSVGGAWALFDRTTRTIDLASGRLDLSTLVGQGDDAQLQQPTVDGSEVLLAHLGGVVAIPIASGSPRSLTDDGGGTPSIPIVVDGCRYAAWANGSAWSSCGGRPGVTDGLAGVSADPDLRYRVNDGILVLNDTRTGSIWAVQDQNRLIDNWDDLIDDRPADTLTEKNDSDEVPEYEKSELPPVATPDTFGARPGRPTTLPVLINDFDANGDVLVIDSTTQPADGRIDIVGGGQQLQLTLPPTASGTLTFDYTINDGRGSSDSAEVTVEIRTEEENSPPEQVRGTNATVAQDGRVSTQVLTDWYDPDGDAIYLDSASAPSDTVAFKPDGTVIFIDGAGGPAQARITLGVSDGRDTGFGALVVKVKAAGNVPIIADPFVVSIYVGEEATVSPLAHVHGGTGTLKLSSVPAKPDVTITPDFDAGTFLISSDTPGTYYIDYAVTDGALPGAGMVRVDVLATTGSSVPITVPHTVYVRALSDATIDVLASDIDPSGGVLLLTGVSDVPEESGMRVEILEQRLLRITLTRPLDQQNTAFSYSISNGAASAEGRVTVIEVPQPSERQAPIANADTASVRVGDVIDIPVLANDEQPDGDPLTLDPTLPDRPADSGLAFASGQNLRYLAPDKPGNYTAVYRVDAPDGQFANGEVKISVREVDAASNREPVPRLVTARVFAGDTVRITIPLAGIDPDGDSVQLLGQDSNPQKGAVTDSGTDWLEYTSGQYSAGTDTFTYSVVDALGSRATGTVRIGISERLDGARNPTAVPDVVTARPGSTVLVRVLANDSDPDGGALTVTAVEPTSASGATAAVDDDGVVEVQVPQAPGDYGFVYTIQNARGGSNSSFLTVQASTDAPLSHPVARDTVLTLSDVLDRTSIDVDVLANVFFADGPAQQLKLSLLPDYATTAVVTASKRVRVRIEKSSQIIPFRVAHPDDPSVEAYALIRVPGSDDALPQIRRTAPTIQVASEAAVTIDINDYVVAIGDRDVRLTDSGTVRATHADGSDLVVDDDTLRFRSIAGYFGPASISFEVTDAATGDDDGRVSTIVLPITVVPRENQPPTFDGAVLEFEPGQKKVIQLVDLTSYPYPDDVDQLRYSIVGLAPDGFSTSLDDGSLTIVADEDTKTGDSTSVTIGVRDDANTGLSGRIVLRVVPSTRPIAAPAPDSAIAPRGQTTTIDVLKNDNATNPFPATPLRVLQVTGIGTTELPDGVSVVPSADKATLTVTVAPTAAPVDTNLQYQVADATGDRSRYAWGTVRISVQDRPDPVTGLRVTGFGDGTLTVGFDAAGFNNSPITGYDVALVSAATGAVVSSTPCAATTCGVATPGNGEANAVRARVTATNGIGASDAAESQAAAWSDVIPPAPTGLTAAPLDGGLRLGWDAVPVPGAGTPVGTYVVSVGGTELGELSAAAVCTAGRCTIDAGSLVNGSSVAFTVSARNGAYPALSSWNSSSGSGVPYGAPVAASVDVVADSASGAVTVQWAPFADNGDPVREYYVQRLADTAPGAALPSVPTGASGCSVSTPAPGSVSPPTGAVQTLPPDATSARFDGLTGDDTSYNFVVWGYNRAGCAATVVDGSVVRPGPGPITAIDASVVEVGSWTQDLVVRSIAAGPEIARFQMRLVDAGGTPISDAVDVSGSVTPRTLFGRSYGETLRFQVLGCTSWGSCGPWSSVAPSEPKPSLTWELPSRAYTRSDPGAGETNTAWSWTNDPANGADYPASYRCFVAGSDPEVSVSVPAGATSCVIPGLPADATVRLEITINGLTRTYSPPPAP